MTQQAAAAFGELSVNQSRSRLRLESGKNPLLWRAISLSSDKDDKQQQTPSLELDLLRLTTKQPTL